MCLALYKTCLYVWGVTRKSYQVLSEHAKVT